MTYRGTILSPPVPLGPNFIGIAGARVMTGSGPAGE
jgi:hypothetical protein